MSKWTLGQVGKTKPIQTQFKPNSNPIYPVEASGEAGTNPIQTQSKPIITIPNSQVCPICHQRTMNNELIKTNPTCSELVEPISKQNIV